MAMYVSHDPAEESPEAKARWFQSLTIEERMDFLCEVTEMALSRNPEIAKKRDAPTPDGRVLVLEAE
jgi:hypothetical protein